MNQTRAYRFALRSLLLITLLSLVGCTVYYPPRYSDSGVYYDDYDRNQPVGRGYAGGGVSVYSALPVHYPYWSLDYFYFSQFYHPYSVYVGYYEPFYHPYPGWFYGYRPYRPYRPGLSINIGFSSYPWYWHGHHYRPSHYGWFGSGYYGRSYRRGYRHGYHDGRDYYHDNRARRVSERMRQVRDRDVAYSRANLLSRNGRSQLGSRSNDLRGRDVNRAAIQGQRGRVGTGRNVNRSTLNRSAARTPPRATRERVRNTQNRARSQTLRDQARRNPGGTGGRSNQARRSGDTLQQGIRSDLLRGNQASGRQSASRQPQRASVRERGSEAFDVRNNTRAQAAPERRSSLRQSRSRSDAAPAVRARAPQPARAPDQVRQRSSQRQSTRVQPSAPRRSAPRQQAPSRPASPPAQRREAPRQQPRQPAAPSRSPRSQNNAPRRASEPASRPRSERRPSQRSRGGERRSRARDSDG